MGPLATNGPIALRKFPRYGPRDGTRSYTPTLQECLAAALRGRLYMVDTGNCGEDCLTVAQTSEDALSEIASAVYPDGPERENFESWDTLLKAKGWSAEKIELDSDHPESLDNFLARCTERAPPGWDVEKALLHIVTVFRAPPPLSACRGNLWLCADGPPTRRDENGVQWFDDPTAWKFYLHLADE